MTFTERMTAQGQGHETLATSLARYNKPFQWFGPTNLHIGKVKRSLTRGQRLQVFVRTTDVQPSRSHPRKNHSAANSYPDPLAEKGEMTNNTITIFSPERFVNLNSEVPQNI